MNNLGDDGGHVESCVFEDLVASALRQELIGGSELEDSDARISGTQIAADL